MRKPLIAGNWKMHGARRETHALLTTLKAGAEALMSVEWAVFPPFVFLEQTERLLTGSSLVWGAQNVSEKATGAFTGEIAASMLLEFRCRYVLVGHSGRREL